MHVAGEIWIVQPACAIDGEGHLSRRGNSGVHGLQYSQIDLAIRVQIETARSGELDFSRSGNVGIGSDDVHLLDACHLIAD